jgi:hypothetical protein
MSRLSLRLFTLAVSIVAAGTVLGSGDDDAVTLSGISGYRQWTKVNPEPVKVETSLNLNGTFTAVD